MSDFAGGISFSAAAKELEMPLRTFELLAARHEHVVGRAVKIGQSRILSAAQWQQLKALIAAEKAEERKA